MERRSAKYTDAKVKEVLRLYFEEKWSQAKIARELSIPSVTIGRIVRGETRLEVMKECGYTPEADKTAQAYEGPEPSLAPPSAAELKASLEKLSELASETSAVDELTSHGSTVIEEFLKKRNAASGAAGEPNEEIAHEPQAR